MKTGMQTTRRRSSSMRGLSYIEVLIAAALLAAALAPALQAVTGGLLGTRVHADLSQGMTPVFGKMEELLARPYPVLQRAAASTGSAGGSATTAVAVYNPAQTLAFPLPATPPAGPGFSDPAFDVYIHSIDPATGGAASSDTGLLQIRVVAKAGGQTLTTYKARVATYE